MRLLKYLNEKWFGAHKFKGGKITDTFDNPTLRDIKETDSSHGIRFTADNRNKKLYVMRYNVENWIKQFYWVNNKGIR